MKTLRCEYCGDIIKAWIRHMRMKSSTVLLSEQRSTRFCLIRTLRLMKSRFSFGAKDMTVKELMEILNGADPNMEVVICAPDSGYYTDDFIEYDVDKKDVGEEHGKFYISVG